MVKTVKLFFQDITLSKVCLYGALGLFVYMPFHVFLTQWLSTYTGGLEIWKGAKDVLTFLVTILCVAYVYYKHRQTALYNLLLGITLAYGLLHILLIYTTGQPLDTGLLATVYNTRLFGYLLIGYSLALIFPKKAPWRLLVRLLLIVSTIVCVFALLQRVLPADIMTHFGYSLDRGTKPNFFIDDKPDFPRVFSTLRDPNSLGAFLILPVTVLAHKLIVLWNSQKRQLVGGLLILHILVLFLTFSRSTLLAMILSLTCLAVFSLRKQLVQHRVVVASVAVCTVVMLAGLFIATKDSYVTQNLVLHADEQTVLEDPNELRVSLFKKGIDGVAEQPLGHGPGTAGLVSTRLPDGLLTENYYLQIAYEVGLFGLLLFIAILYLILKELWQRRASGSTIALLTAFIGLLFANLLFHTFSNEAVAAAFFMLLGTIIRSNKVT